MVRRVLIPSVLVCALGAGAATSAHAATAASTSNPTVTAVKPLKVAIGETMTIRGRGFLPGKLRNTVVFQRDDSEPVFVRADNATSTRITLVVPDKLLPFLSQKGGDPKTTRFKLRILSRRLGRSFTKPKLSPKIAPPKDTGGGGTTSTPQPPPESTNPGTPPVNVPKDAPPAPAPPAGPPDPRGPDGDCDQDGIPNKLETDADNDLVSDADEINKYKTDWCNADSDRDGISDGYEIESALDMNSRALPYPGKRPYPNALDGSDAGTDHDGDGLTEQEEYTAWARYGGHQLPLNYSDGTQETGGPQAANPPGVYPDVAHTRGGATEPPNGVLTDDEKDVDGDGLSNWDELHGAFARFTNMNFEPTLDWLDPDTDGDGVKDGADDQDQDGTFGGVDLTNLEEISAGHDGRVTDPTNPCDPNPLSGFCPQHGSGGG